MFQSDGQMPFAKEEIRVPQAPLARIAAIVGGQLYLSRQKYQSTLENFELQNKISS